MFSTEFLDLVGLALVLFSLGSKENKNCKYTHGLSIPVSTKVDHYM
jgi:hypothetical protein